MRRVGLGLVLVLVAAVALPPLWFRLFRQVPPELPPLRLTRKNPSPTTTARPMIAAT